MKPRLTKVIPVRISARDRRRLRAIAARETDGNVSDLIRAMIQRALLDGAGAVDSGMAA
jgi:hypothetical protein